MTSISFENFLVEQEEQNEVKCILKYNDVDRKDLQKISKHLVDDLYLQVEIFDIYISYHDEYL